MLSEDPHLTNIKLQNQKILTSNDSNIGKSNYLGSNTDTNKCVKLMVGITGYHIRSKLTTNITITPKL